MQQARQAIRASATATGEWRVSTQRIMSQSERINDSLQRQKMSVADIARNWRGVQSAMRQQMRLQNSMALSYGTDRDGKVSADLYTPTGLDKSLRSARMELGYYNQVLNSVAGRTIDWGKNTQWAGRQLMVGIGIPIGLIATAAAAMAYSVDSELTRIAKVYDTTATNAIAREREIANVRDTSLRQSISIAKEYGIAVNESLKMQANLAATGLSGDELLGTSRETARISSLGEFDLDQATEMTVALKTTFAQSNAELTETFNMMNSVENATSLSIADIAEATPRAGSAIAQMNGSVSDMVLLLVAMKESGIDAAEGANALKSATTRLLNPTARAKTQFREFGVDIQALVQQKNGNIVEIFEALAVSLKDVDDIAKQQAIASLFGTYQFNRINAALQNLAVGMGVVGNATNQTTKAYEVLAQDSGKWSKAALAETQRAANSASGQLKRTFEQIKGELALIGEPILEMLNPVAKAIGGLLSWFNELPKGVKQFSLVTIALAGLMGVGVMFTGLFANMIGQIFKTGSALANLILKFKIVNPEQQTAALLAKAAAGSYDTQAGAVARLTLEMQKYNDALMRQNGMTGKLSNGNLLIGGKEVKKTANGGFVTAGVTNENGKTVGANNFISADALKKAQEMDGVADSTGKAARNAKSLNINMQAVGGSMLAAGIGGSILNDTVGGSNQKAQDLLGTVGMVGMALSFLPLNFGKLTGSLKNAGPMVGKIGAFFNGIGKSLLTLVTSGLKFWGPVGILATGLMLIIRYNKQAEEGVRHQQELNKAGEDWADILGYTYNLNSTAGGENPTEALVQGMKDLKEANAALYDDIKNANGISEVQEMARSAAMSVLATGGSMDQAKLSMEIVFQTAGITGEQAQWFIDDTASKLQSADSTSLVNAFRDKIASSLQTAISEMDSNNWFEDLFLSGFISKDSKEAAIKAGGEINEGFASALRVGGVEAGIEFLDSFSAPLADARKPVFQKFLENNQDILSSFSVQTEADMIELSEKVNSAIARNPNDPWFEFEGETRSINEVKSLLASYENEMQGVTELESQLARTFAEANGATDKQLKSIKNLDDAFAAIYPNYVSQDDIARQYNNTLRQMSSDTTRLSDKTKTQVLNSILSQHGMESAADANEYFAGTAKEAAAGAEQLADELEDTAPSAKDYANAMKEAFTSAIGANMDEASRLYEEQNERTLDGIEASSESRVANIESRREASEAAYDKRIDSLKKKNENEMKAFDDRWESILDNHSDGWEKRIEAEEAAYDRRTKAIEAQIEKEEEAEQARQDMFDAEIARIEALAEAHNNNIDFNSALNRGDTDEAAQIANNAISSENVGALESMRDRLSRESDVRRNALDETIGRIGEEKEARLDALRQVQEAETEARQDQRDREKEALAERQKNAEDSLAAQKKSAADALSASIEAERRRTQNVLEARKREQDAQKRRLDAELAALRETIPTNEAEYQAHTRKLEEIYGRYGITLVTQGKGWNNTVATNMKDASTNAANQIMNDTKWKEVGNKIVQDMSSAVGLNSQQMMSFLMTGEWPKRVVPADQKLPTKSGNAVRHTGGFTSKDRTGVPRNAGVYPSEILTLQKRGEFVVKADRARQYQSELEAINSGTFMARHTGGPVGPTATAGIGGSAMVANVMRQALLAAVLRQSMQGALATYSGITGTGGTEGSIPPAASAPLGVPAAAGGVSALLQFGRILMNRGFTVSENAALGDNPRPGSHSATGYHYKYNNSGAIDVNAGAGESLAEKRRLAPVVKEALRMGFGAQFISPGHYNHAHFDVGSYRNVGNLQPYLPSAATGAMIRHDNTLVNTHRGETVLTAPLTRAVIDGAQNVGGGSSNYTVKFENVSLRDENDMDSFMKKVESTLDRIETKKGRRRVVR